MSFHFSPVKYNESLAHNSLLRYFKFLPLGMLCVVCICCSNGPQVLGLMEKVILGTLLGDIPAPPNYAIRYEGYGSGWLLTYRTELTREVLKEYYLKVLPEQWWEIEHYSGRFQECILAKRGWVVRVVEIGVAPQYESDVDVRFNEVFCNFENFP